MGFVRIFVPYPPVMKTVFIDKKKFGGWYTSEHDISDSHAKEKMTYRSGYARTAIATYYDRNK